MYSIHSILLFQKKRLKSPVFLVVVVFVSITILIKLEQVIFITLNYTFKLIIILYYTDLTEEAYTFGKSGTDFEFEARAFQETVYHELSHKQFTYVCFVFAETMILKNTNAYKIRLFLMII